MIEKILNRVTRKYNKMEKIITGLKIQIEERNAGILYFFIIRTKFSLMETPRSCSVKRVSVYRTGLSSYSGLVIQ